MVSYPISNNPATNQFLQLNNSPDSRREWRHQSSQKSNTMALIPQAAANYLNPTITLPHPTAPKAELEKIAIYRGIKVQSRIRPLLECTPYLFRSRYNIIYRIFTHGPLPNPHSLRHRTRRRKRQPHLPLSYCVNRLSTSWTQHRQNPNNSPANLHPANASISSKCVIPSAPTSLLRGHQMRGLKGPVSDLGHGVVVALELDVLGEALLGVFDEADDVVESLDRSRRPSWRRSGFVSSGGCSI